MSGYAPGWATLQLAAVHPHRAPAAAPGRAPPTRRPPRRARRTARRGGRPTGSDEHRVRRVLGAQRGERLADDAEQRADRTLALGVGAFAVVVVGEHAARAPQVATGPARVLVVLPEREGGVEQHRRARCPDARLPPAPRPRRRWLAKPRRSARTRRRGPRRRGVALVPRLQVRQRPQGVGPAEVPELEQHRPAAQLLHAQRLAVDPRRPGRERRRRDLVVRRPRHASPQRRPLTPPLQTHPHAPHPSLPRSRSHGIRPRPRSRPPGTTSRIRTRRIRPCPRSRSHGITHAPAHARPASPGAPADARPASPAPAADARPAGPADVARHHPHPPLTRARHHPHARSRPPGTTRRIRTCRIRPATRSRPRSRRATTPTPGTHRRTPSPTPPGANASRPARSAR